MPLKFLLVGLGGAVGAMLRYAISCIPYKGTFPLLTLLTNVTGAFLIGVIAGLAAQKCLSESVQLFLKTGVCGGYTTFSTFSLEAFQLFQGGRHAEGVLYLLLSVAGSLLGVYLGLQLGRGGFRAEV